MYQSSPFNSSLLVYFFCLLRLHCSFLLGAASLMKDVHAAADREEECERQIKILRKRHKEASDTLQRVKMLVFASRMNALTLRLY